jgi:Tol biopolymer transport system component
MRQELRSIGVADGTASGAQEIVTSGGYIQFLGFSRDGSLYFTRQRGHASLFVADVNPANWKSLGAPAEVSSPENVLGSGAAAWSPDGKVLAYQLLSSQNSTTIVLRRLDGTPEREVSFTKPVTLRSWSSDGRLLISTGKDLKLYDVETGREQLLIGDKQFEAGNGSSGREFVVHERAVYYYTIARETGAPDNVRIVRLMRADINTGERRELHHLVTGNAPPRLFRLQVSPDGRSLAFRFPGPDSSADSPSQSAVLVPLSGGEPRPLPGFAAWTPDSKAVLFEKSPGDIWVQPIDGGKMDSTGIRFDASWDELGVVVHPDGRRIAMIWRVNTYDVAVIRNLFSKR